MTRIRNEEIEDFRGMNTNIPAQRLPDQMAQVDEGSDRYRRGSWRRRRGMRHSSLPKFDGPILGILGFDLKGPDYAVLLVEGTNVQGNLNVTQQDDSGGGAGAGFGGDGFGEGGFSA